jgi:hypothetical protein
VLSQLPRGELHRVSETMMKAHYREASGG